MASNDYRSAMEQDAQRLESQQARPPEGLSPTNDELTLRKLAQSDHAASIKSRRTEEKKRREAAQRGDVIRAVINSPHKVTCRGNNLAITIAKGDENNLPPEKELPAFPACAGEEKKYVLGLVVPACGGGPPYLTWFPTSTCA